MTPVSLFVAAPTPERAAAVIEEFQYRRFAAALGRALGADVALRTGSAAELPPVGFVLLHCEGGLADLLAADAERCQRLVLLQVDRAELKPLLSRFPLAGAADRLGYHWWQFGAANESGWSGIVGREPLVRGLGIGARMEGVPYAVASARGKGFVELLAAYLQALARDPE